MKPNWAYIAALLIILVIFCGIALFARSAKEADLNNAYKQGYNAGFDNAVASITPDMQLESAYQNGYGEGYSDGKSDGYNEGWNYGYDMGYSHAQDRLPKIYGNDKGDAIEIKPPS